MALGFVWETVAILVQATKRLGETIVQTTALILVGSLADRWWVYVWCHNNLHTATCQVRISTSHLLTGVTTLTQL